MDANVPPVARRHRILRAGMTAVFLVRLERRMRVVRPNLVHIHVAELAGFWEKALFGVLVSRHGVPWVLHVHGGRFAEALQGLGGPQRRFMARTLRRAAAVVVPARAWQPLFSALAPAARLVVLPNAIHVADFDPSPRPTHDPPVRVLFLGMLSPRKGFEDLLRALLEVRDQGGTPFVLDVVGGEECPGELRRTQALCARAGLGSQVRFHGERSGAEKLRFLAAADLFVLPSRSESFGIVNLEAMASGLPVLSTRTGAIPEYLEDGCTGLLVEPSRWPELAASLRRLIEDRALRDHLGRNASQRVHDYDWAVVGDQIVTLYMDCLSAKLAGPEVER